MNKFLVLLLIFISFVSCNEGVQIPEEIASQNVDVQIVRFDQQFAGATPENLPALKKEFPYFFSKRFPDEYWHQKFTDTLQLEINQELEKGFPDFQDEKESLDNLFKHITYYYPQVKVPKAVTVASEVEYNNKVILVDSLLIISLDTYLGEDHHFYAGIPVFQSKNFRKEQIDVDVAEAFAKTVVPKPKNTEFLSEMLYEGKKIYLMKSLLSLRPEYEVLGYTEDELTFARNNEINIWEYFVKKELLYSTDRKLLSRFLNPAPFSKFYLSFDNETPGRIARYMGYEIVSSYMEKNDVPLKTMLIQDAATIFASAKYKP